MILGARASRSSGWLVNGCQSCNSFPPTGHFATAFKTPHAPRLSLAFRAQKPPMRKPLSTVTRRVNAQVVRRSPAWPTEPKILLRHQLDFGFVSVFSHRYLSSRDFIAERRRRRPACVHYNIGK